MAGGYSETHKSYLLDDPIGSKDDGSTPLDEDEKQGLIPSWVTFRHELNEVEQENIARARIWAFRKIRKPSIEILDETFIRSLHKRMLGDVWQWAGRFRQSDKNIGVSKFQIAEQLRNLIEDARTWLEYNSYSSDELLARLHHGLVAIHPFPNGNGRHARLIIDLLASRLGVEPFTWGGGDLAETDELRKRYIKALQLADQRQFEALISFMRLER